MFNAPAPPSINTNRVKSFLYADDNVDDRIIVRFIIRTMCQELVVHFVNDGTEAVAWLAGKGVYADRNAYPLPDLLLVDLRMPRMDGFELMRWVRTRPELAHLPIVIHSDSLVHDVQHICKGLGAIHYISKDPRCTALKEFVRTYITAHGLRARERPSTDESPRQRS
jgi:CheY-like chemotaxis protein